MLEQLIHLDKQIIVALNGSGTIPFLDQFMFLHTHTQTWLLFFVALIYVVVRRAKWQQALAVILGAVVVLVLSDQISSGICKPFFERLRPSRDPSVMNMLHFVNDYRAHNFSFISGHATNSFAILTFLILVIKDKRILIFGGIWALLHCYTRIYLGVHFLGDILAGICVGLLVGSFVYTCYRYLTNRFCPNHHFSRSDVNIALFALLANYLYVAVRAYLQIV